MKRIALCLVPLLALFVVSCENQTNNNNLETDEDTVVSIEDIEEVKSDEDWERFELDNVDIQPEDHLKIEFVSVDEKGDSLLKFQHLDNQGILLEEGIIKNRKYAGEVTWFYRSGGKKTTGFYNDQTPYGNWVDYYEDGSKQAEYSYKNGKLDSIYTYYHPNGNIWTQREYKEGLFWNILSNKDADGNVVDPGTLKDGTGTVKIYNEDGSFNSEVNYTNGLPK
ncbi:MAG: hypothetical protein C0594_08950 [Marinilabiliales bacterium]|nr:MAG: hypothetical protein C0594_08950 [Marinilabiliales bacterium]